MAIVATHRIDDTTQNCNTDVAATGVHGRNILPLASIKVIASTRVKVLESVEATNHVHLAIENGAAMVCACTLRIQHVLGSHPPVGSAVVALNNRSRGANAPSTNCEHYVMWYTWLRKPRSLHFLLDELEATAVTVKLGHRVDDCATLAVLANNGILSDILRKERLVHDAKSDLAHDVSDVAATLVWSMVDPFERKFPDGLFDVHIQMV